MFGAPLFQFLSVSLIRLAQLLQSHRLVINKRLESFMVREQGRVFNVYVVTGSREGLIQVVCTLLLRVCNCAVGVSGGLGTAKIFRQVSLRYQAEVLRDGHRRTVTEVNHRVHPPGVLFKIVVSVGRQENLGCGRATMVDV
ncbi:MAG: hypothetical protein GY906_30810 [bacterium]|nr:hypothetical protein [bacterium]